jgi:hypothetical protein
MKQEKNNITLYIIILLGCLILGCFYYLTQRSEQKLQLDIIQREFEAEDRRRGDEELKEATELRRREDCNQEANKEAASLLESKIEVMEGMSNLDYANRQLLQQYKEASAKGMYLKEDFEALYKNCLSKYGLNP